MNKSILIITGTFLALLIFTSCSKDHNNNVDVNTSTSQEQIAVNVNCITPITQDAIDTYITMLSGDILVEDANDTVVQTYLDTDGTKKICRVSGNAHLIRE